MRSLRTAARTVVLVTLTGAAPGCGYDNPGFKLKDSDPETDSAAQTTSVSGVTMMTTTETSPTTSTTSTSTAEPMTTQGPGVSGSETSTTAVDPTTETGSGTSTGDLLPWDDSCHEDDRIEASPVPAVADAFFLYLGAGSGGNVCDVGLNGWEGMTDCVDRNTGKIGVMSLVSLYYDNEDLDDDLVNVFGARFDVPAIKYDGETVPPEAFATALLTVTVFRGTETKPILNVYPMGAGIPWIEGEKTVPEECAGGEPTYRCRACSDPPNELTCAADWEIKGQVFKSSVYGGTALGLMETDVQKGATGVAKFELLDHAQVLQAFNGLVVAAQPTLVGTDKFQVKTLNDSDSSAPTLTIKFCPNPNKPKP